MFSMFCAMYLYVSRDMSLSIDCSPLIPKEARRTKRWRDRMRFRVH